MPKAALAQNAAIVRHLITLLERASGKLSYQDAALEVLKIGRPSAAMAKRVFTGLLAADARFELGRSHLVLRAHHAEETPLASNTYVVVDLETTGADTGRNRITEMALIKVRGGKVVDEFSTLVNPNIPVPTFITQLTGITDEMVRRAPKFEEVAQRAVEFVGDSVLVAHNANFDVRFLSAELDRVISAGLASPYVCTLQTARHILHGLPNYRLDTVAAHYDVEIQGRHTAPGDARATAEIWMRMAQTLEAYGVPSLSVARGFRLFPQHSLL